MSLCFLLMPFNYYSKYIFLEKNETILLPTEAGCRFLRFIKKHSSNTSASTVNAFTRVSKPFSPPFAKFDKSQMVNGCG